MGKWDVTDEDRQQLKKHKEFVAQEANPEKKDKKKRSNWQKKNQFTSKNFKSSDFFTFMCPVIWEGPFSLKLASVSLFILLIISQIFGVIYPLIFKNIVDNIACNSEKENCLSKNESYFLILQYVGLKFISDFLTNIK